MKTLDALIEALNKAKKSLEVKKDDPSIATNGVSSGTTNTSAAQAIMSSGGFMHKNNEQWSLDKAIKPGPALNYATINPKPDRAAQEAAAPTINYSNRVAAPTYTGAADRAAAVRAKLDAEAKEPALDTIARRQKVNKTTNESYQSGTNTSGAGDDMAMSEKEPHKDDPHHEAKEKKAASKIKNEAEEILDMHKDGGQDILAMSENGQWYLKKTHVGFKALEGKLEHEGHSADSAGAIAASIGRKKYGAKKMAEMAHKAESCYKAEDDKDKS